MALVKCTECDRLISNKALQCPNCGYSPKGTCERCLHYEYKYGFSSGRCNATIQDYVKKDKSVCPAVIKRIIF